MTSSSSYIVMRSPHGDHLDVPDCTLPTLLLRPLSTTPSDRLSKPISLPSPTSVRSPQKPPSSSPLSFDTAAPLSLVQLCEIADRIAVSLLSSSSSSSSTKWSKGSVVAFYSTNQHDYCAAVMGVQIAGGIAALCNPAYKPRELAHQLRMTSASVIITTADSYQSAIEAAELASDSSMEDPCEPIEKPRVLVFDEDHEASLLRTLLSPPQEAWQKREELIKTVQIDPAKDTALYCFRCVPLSPIMYAAC